MALLESSVSSFYLTDIIGHLFHRDHSNFEGFGSYKDFTGALRYYSRRIDMHMGSIISITHALFEENCHLSFFFVN
jgi:hypothetical protein